MSRRIARELALQSLFQIDFNECGAEVALEAAVEECTEENIEKAKKYALVLVEGVLNMLLIGLLNVCLLPIEIFCVLLPLKCSLQKKR